MERLEEGGLPRLVLPDEGGDVGLESDGFGVLEVAELLDVGRDELHGMPLGVGPVRQPCG